MSAVENTRPFHDDFSWLADNIKHDINARFAAKVRTLASGCATIAQITQQHMLDTGAKERPLLSEGDMYNLVSLIAPLMYMLDDAADDQITRIDNEATTGARK